MNKTQNQAGIINVSLASDRKTPDHPSNTHFVLCVSLRNLVSVLREELCCLRILGPETKEGTEERRVT